VVNPGLLREAHLLLAWARGAGGRWLPAEEAAPPGLLAPWTPPAASAAAAGGVRSQVRRAAARGGLPAPPEATPAPTPVSREECAAGLARIAADADTCTRCVLAATRAHTVPGEGDPGARLVIVGEAPGAEEDRTGRPFVGAAGRLLTKMLAAIGLARDEVFICNLLKCRPPGNRTPRPDEVACCKPFLREQLRLLNPEIVLALGSPAARELLQTRRGITSLRGRFMRSREGLRIMPTFHPAYLLRNPAAKREVWLDLQRVATELGMQIPPREGS